MPLIKQKPSLNHEVVKTMTKKELIELHPLADEDYLSEEYDRIMVVDKPKDVTKRTGKPSPQDEHMSHAGASPLDSDFPR